MTAFLGEASSEHFTREKTPNFSSQSIVTEVEYLGHRTENYVLTNALLICERVSLESKVTGHKLDKWSYAPSRQQDISQHYDIHIDTGTQLPNSLLQDKVFAPPTQTSGTSS